MALADSTRNAMHDFYKKMMEGLTSAATTSEFVEKGTLTPNEFVIAGDKLVNQCPTWTWEEGEIKQKWPFLNEKQFLQTRNVPCLARVAALLHNPNETIVENGEWLSMDDQGTHQAADEIADIDLDSMTEIVKCHKTNDNDNNNNNITNDNTDNNNNNINGTDNSDNNNNRNIINIVEHSAFNNETTNTDNNNNNSNESNNDRNDDDEDDDLSDSYEEIPDIDTFNDEDNIVPKKNTSNNSNNDKTNSKNTNNKNNDNTHNNNNNNNENEIENNINSISNDNDDNDDEMKTDDTLMFKLNQDDNDTIVRTRTYDISITYDKYYKVPRIWLRGYDENGNPLTSSQIFEDISADHAHKTVTVKCHPHILGVICAGIHPCRHSEVMKRFMVRMESGGTHLTVDQYMFLFLKFMSAVIPTIEYDFTQSVDG